MQARRQGIYWMLTIPVRMFPDGWDELPTGIRYFKGQQELGESGFQHWQAIAILEKKGSCNTLQSIFGQGGHYELTRSENAEDYVWKEDTRVEGTQFEFGSKPKRRNSARDWEEIWELAKEGDLENIDAAVRICHWRSLTQISTKYAKPLGIERLVYCFWGKTGTGKSRRAWEEGGLDAYPKDPRSKFWDGYRDQEHVIIDEFRGGINESHILRWTDRYPVIVEVKGSSIVLRAKTIWITSNLHPKDWYPNLDYDTMDALIRRMEIIKIE